MGYLGAPMNDLTTTDMAPEAPELERHDLAYLQTILPTLCRPDSDAFDQTLVSTGRAAPRQSLAPTVARDSKAPVRRRHTSLPLLQLGDTGSTGGSPPHFEVERVLGTGGMGVVRLARQAALGRRVALKSVRDSFPDHLEDYLFREARLTGMVEHPNVVPVYSLGVDQAGHLILVMKRIEGVEWAELLDNSKHELWPSLGEDQRRWHLETLVKLARALQFAHTRGVIHRDLKPQNVMVGSHGQVYLMDWGVAIEASEPNYQVAGVAGTPAYMPPEMADADLGCQDERVDVYLLGAVLYEILAGRPPHPQEGIDTLLVALRERRVSSPPLPAGTPRGLVRIVERSMALQPEERYASADEFRRALSEYLDHAKAFELLRSGLDSVELLREKTGRAQRSDLTPSQLGDINRTFGACRYALGQAREALPPEDAAEAAEALQRAVQHMVRFELAIDNTSGALAMLDELLEPDPGLEAEVAAAQEEVRYRNEQLKAFREREADMSLAAGQRSLAVITWGIAAFVAVAPLVLATVLKAGIRKPKPIGLLIISVALLVCFVGMLRRYRDRVTPNRGTRVLWTGLASLMFGLVMSRVTSTIQRLDRLFDGLDYAETWAVLSGDFLVVAYGTTVLGLVADRVLLRATPVYWFGLFLAHHYPSYAIECFGVFNALALWIVGTLWSRRGPDPVLGKDVAGRA